MIEQRFFKVKKIVFSVLLMLLFIRSGIMQNENNNLQFKPDGNIDFYEYIIDEYVWLIKKVYQGDTPFFVLVTDVYSDEEHGIFNIQFSYTLSFAQLKKYDEAIYYKYKQDSIYVLINNFQGDRQFITDLQNNFHAGRITEHTMQDLFYPLTEDFFFEDMQKNKTRNVSLEIIIDSISNNKYYEVSKYKDEISAKENGISINFFTDYKKNE